MKKVALVTGASSGIGKQTALALSRAGYKVYGGARRTSEMADLQKVGISIVYLDVTDRLSCEQAVKRIISENKRIDILVNNAGFGFYGTVEDVPLDEARQQLEVNLFGAVRMIQLVLPYMREKGKGKIVNISSIAGRMATPLGAWYHASKYGMEAVSDSLRLEVAGFGIKVIIIEPGIIATPWWWTAKKNLEKVSGNSVYNKLLANSGKILDIDDKASDPTLIARLIIKVLRKRRPKARYHAGYRASFIIGAKKRLSDRMFDAAIRKQLDL